MASKTLFVKLLRRFLYKLYIVAEYIFVQKEKKKKYQNRIGGGGGRKLNSIYLNEKSN